AHVRNLLEDDDELIPALQDLKPVPLQGFNPKEIPKLKKDPTIWTKEFSIDSMEALPELGKELVLPSTELPPQTFNLMPPQTFPSIT
ncbi:hypothetical protein Dimus_020728, partial [Dionaea muscipula]